MMNFAPGLEGLFEFVPPEGELALSVSSGDLPDWLVGTAYWNGPARFHRGDLRYQHWLDGDGMVGALRFGREGLSYTRRFVRSHKWVAEEEAGRLRFRTFGTRFPGDELVRGVQLASPVNVSVFPFAGKLLAFGEQGLPFELNDRSLETVGEHSFGGRINAVSPFSAHAKLDPENHELFNFGISFAATEPQLNLYRFAGDGTMLFRKRHGIDLPASVHDFGLSGKVAIIHLGPYLMDVRPFMEQGLSVQESLTWEPERGSRLLLYSRETGESLSQVAVGAGYSLHHINAFENQDGHLVVDLLELEEPVYPDYQPLPDLFVNVKAAHPTRYVVDAAKGEVLETVRLPFSMAADFPMHEGRVMSRPYDRFWMLSIAHTGEPGRKFLDRVHRGDWGTGKVDEIYACPENCYLAGEPVVVSSPDHGEPLVIVPEIDLAKQSGRFLVIEGTSVRARLEVPTLLHSCFHACWAGA